MFDPFVRFGLVILVVLGVATVIKILKQPLIIGYILAGILVGPLFLNLIQEGEILDIFSEMGIAFLLFIVGLHLSPKKLKEVGKISLITGLGQVIFTSSIGYFIGRALGFAPIESLYIAIALTFSSTIIIMKLLSDKEALEKLYGKISIGFLLVQDFVVIIALIVISSIDAGEGAATEIFSTLLNGFLVLAILIPMSYYLLPKLSDFFAKSQEFLFLFAISWGFGLSILFYYVGFTIEVGALLAGVSLAISPYSYEIGSKLKPLRDFFIIFFFIILGSQMIFGDISHLFIPAAILSAFIIIGNPIIVMTLMGLLGYSKKTGFMAGLTVAQISEFSLIFIALGVEVGNLSQEILSFVTIIGLATITGSTYMIMYSEFIFKKISKFLTIFERKNIKEKAVEDEEYNYILFGHNRIGFSILDSFSELDKDKKDHVVVDFNPETVKKLKEKDINCIYGDAEDNEFLGDLGIEKAKLVVSTVPDHETNTLILRKVRNSKSDTVVIPTARRIEDALELYEGGADYVIIPHFLGGDYAAKIIMKNKEDKKKYSRDRAGQIEILKKRLIEGHKHPKIEKDKK